MRSKTFQFLFFTIAILISACTNTQISSDSELKSIPQDVSMVTSIDADAILEKADFENVKEMAFYKELISETKRYNATLGDVLANPAQSGVDLSKNIYVSHSLDQNNPEEVFVAIVASVKDKAALETLIKSNADFKMSQHDNFELATKGSQSVAWNAEKVIIGMTNAYSDPVASISKFFNTSADQSIANDTNLQKALSGNHDINSWMSSNALANNGMLKDALIAASIDPNAAKDNFVHGYVDFNDGAIESKSDLYLQAALMEDVNLLFKDKVTTDFSSAIPSTANSVMALALDIEGVQSVLQKKGYLQIANFGMSQYGLTIEDISSTFGGDILLYSTPGKGETPYGTFATNITDNEKLIKFIDLGVQFKVLRKVDDVTYTIPGTSFLGGQGFNGKDAQLLIAGDMVYISADSEIIERLATDGYSGSDRLDKSKIKSLNSNILSGFVDFEDMMKKSRINNIDSKFEDMIFNTNRKSGSFNMNFKEKNTNALKQLFESINEAYLAEKKGAI